MFENNFISNFIIVLSSMIVTFFVFNLNILNIQVKIENTSIVGSIFLCGMFFVVSLVAMLFIHLIIKKLSFSK